MVLRMASIDMQNNKDSAIIAHTNAGVDHLANNYMKLLATRVGNNAALLINVLMQEWRTTTRSKQKEKISVWIKHVADQSPDSTVVIVNQLLESLINKQGVIDTATNQLLEMLNQQGEFDHTIVSFLVPAVFEQDSLYRASTIDYLTELNKPQLLLEAEALEQWVALLLNADEDKARLLAQQVLAAIGKNIDQQQALVSDLLTECAGKTEEAIQTIARFFVFLSESSIHKQPLFQQLLPHIFADQKELVLLSTLWLSAVISTAWGLPLVSNMGMPEQWLMLMTSEYPQSRTIAETVLWYTAKESQNAAQTVNALMKQVVHFNESSTILFILSLAERFINTSHPSSTLLPDLVTGLLCLLSHSSSEIANKASDLMILAICDVALPFDRSYFLITDYSSDRVMTLIDLLLQRFNSNKVERHAQTSRAGKGGRGGVVPTRSYPPVCVRILCALNGMINSDDVHDTVIDMLNNQLPQLLAVIQSSSPDDFKEDAASLILKVMKRNPTVQKGICKAMAVEEWARYFKASNAGLKQLSLYILDSICDATKDRVSKAIDILELVEALSNPDLVLSALSLLRKLSFNNKEKIQEIVAVGVIPCLLSFLKESDHPAAGDSAAVLGILAYKNAVNQETMVQGRVIPLLIQLLNHRHIHVRRGVLQVLNCFAYGLPKYRKLILNEGVLEPLIALLLTETDQKVMVSLLKVSQSLSNETLVKERLKQADCLERLVTLESNAQEPIKTAAVSLLTALGSNKALAKVAVPNPLANRQLYIKEDKITIGAFIGEGGFARVCRGTWSSRDVAVKQFFGNGLPDKIMQQLTQEADIMLRLSHECLVELLGLVDNASGIPWLLMEYYPHNLYNFLRSSSAVTWDLRLRLTLDILRGLEYLHTREPQIIHCDLKSANVLLTRGLNAKLADFGLSKIKTHASASSSRAGSGFSGTVRFFSPEVMSGEKHSAASDIWAMGMVMFEIISSELPYAHIAHEVILINLITQSRLPELPEDREPHPGYEAIMKRCWASRQERPSAADLVVEMREIQPPLEAKQEDSVENFNAYL